MKIYNIKEEYIEFIKQYDANYAPLSSPKLKHRKMKNSKDFRKINQGIYGAINFKICSL